MALWGAQLSCKMISFELQSTLLLLPKLRTTTFGFTRYSLTHNSSTPLRYISKSPTLVKQPQTSFTSNMKLNGHEFENFENGEGFIESEEEEETNNCEEDAEKVAIGALATRSMTALELEKKLRAKNFSPSVINKVLTALQSKGYINDYLYAEAFSQSRWSSSTWGPKRIKQALHQKGVSEANVEKATKYVFGGGDDNESSVLGMSKLSMDHLFLQASKQWTRSQNVSHDKRKARIIRWLQYRGFSWGVVSLILKKLETQHPS